MGIRNPKCLLKISITNFSIFAPLMRIILFFICLLFLLPGGNFNTLHGATHHGICSPRNIKIADRFTNFGTDQDHASIANNNLLPEEKWFDCEDVDDEDSSEVSPKKLSSRAGIHSSYYHLAVLNYHRNFPKALPSFWCQASSRYLLLRTFRV
jgi:hypothetical protein